MRTGSNISVYGNGSVIIEGTKKKYLHSDGSSTVGLGPLLSECLSKPAICKHGFTLALWARIAGKSLPPCCILGTLQPYNRGFGVFLSSFGFGKFLITPFIKSAPFVWNGSIKIESSTWNHIVVSWKPNTTFDAYLNGRRKFSVKARTIIEGGQPECNLTYRNPPKNKDTNLFLYLGGKVDFDDIMIWFHNITEPEAEKVFYSKLGKYFSRSFILSPSQNGESTMLLG